MGKKKRKIDFWEYLVSSPLPLLKTIKLSVGQLQGRKKANKGKSLSEALIFASANPQYDGRLFIELQV